jgi:hypothetical protein
VERVTPLQLWSGRKEERESMRFMLKFRFPTDQGNALAKEGRLGQTVQSIVEELNPEAAYFTDMDGARGGYLVINMDDASQIPAVAEPLFIGLGATIELHAVMTPEDLAKGAPAIEQAAQKYG